MCVRKHESTHKKISHESIKKILNYFYGFLHSIFLKQSNISNILNNKTI